MTKVWCIRERTDVWHALVPAMQKERPEEDLAWFDEILCGDGIVLPGHRVFRNPNCPYCLANLAEIR
jgi:hypothetical protein